MGDSPTQQGSYIEPAGQRPAERLVYVVPEQSLGVADHAISLRELWGIAWRGKRQIIAVTAVFALGTIIYALLATEWYRAEMLLAPAEKQATPALDGGLIDLAALAGLSMGGGDSTEAVATLRSREFARAFIEDFNLLPTFFADDWDAEGKRWLNDDPEEWPDVRDGIEYLHDNVINVTEDRQTGLVTLAIEWTDPEIAATWADTLVRRLNARLRERALQEAQTNVAYLQSELVQTSVVTLQQAIARLLESELQKVMLARGNEEFAFRIIDSAFPPKERVRPKRAILAVLGTLMGGMVSVFSIFLAHALRTDDKALPPKNVSA